MAILKTILSSTWLLLCCAWFMKPRRASSTATSVDEGAARPGARMLPVTSPIQFDALGYGWFVKDSGGGTALPGPCQWTGAGERVWADGDGIHLTVQPDDGNCGGWKSTEVWTKQALGYGNYLFRISGSLQNLDPQVTFGLFTWDDDCPGDCHFREIDFEIARWGNEGDPNGGQWVVQPWQSPGNLKRFNIANAHNLGGQYGPNGGGSCIEPGPDSFGGANWQQLTLMMQWFDGGLLRFFVFNGHHSLGDITGQRDALLASWEFPFKERVPRPGDERVHLNLWQANWGGAPGRGRRVHVVINGMEHGRDWIDMPAAGIYPAGSRRLAVTAVPETKTSAKPTESPDRLKPTPQPKAEPPSGAAKGVAAPAGVPDYLAKYPQVLGDWVTALKFYNPLPGNKEADASTPVGSENQRRMQSTANLNDPNYDPYYDPNYDVFLPGVPAPSFLPQTGGATPGPAATPVSTGSGASPATESTGSSSSTGGGSAAATPGTAAGPTAKPPSQQGAAAGSGAAQDTTVGAAAAPGTGKAAGTTGTGTTGGSTAVPGTTTAKKGTTIALAVMGSALAAVGVAAAGAGVRRALKRGTPILGETAPQGGAKTLRRSGGAGGIHASAESGDATYASWREPWSAATPDYVGRSDTSGSNFPEQAGQPGAGTAEQQARPTGGPDAMGQGATATGTSPNRTTARHRTASGGYAPYNEGPAEAVAHGHHARPAQATGAQTGHEHA